MIMKNISIQELLHELDAKKFVGDQSKIISELISLDRLVSSNGDCPNALCWVGDDYVDRLKNLDLNVGLLIIGENVVSEIDGINSNVLIVSNPRFTFQKILSHHFKENRVSKIENSAIIANDVSIGQDCYIGHNVVIESGSQIGNNCVIMHNSVVLRNCSIGNNVTIGCNNTIGNYGFGYEKDEKGDQSLIQHVGNVEIHDNVEIHNNTCIDRAVLGSTIIEENVKIDNQVHIAHGVHVMRNSLVIANALIAGSVKVGENSWIGPTSTIKNQLNIAPGTLTGLGSVIVKDTDENSIMVGNPAIKLEEYKEWSNLRKKLEKDKKTS